jgi:hypothetical protein
MYRQHRSMLFPLMRTALHAPGLLMALSVTCSLTAVGLAVVGGGDRRADAAAIVLVLLGSLLGMQVWRIAGRPGLRARQRVTLLQALGRMQPLQVKVSAVNRRVAVRYARDLRAVMRDANWPVTGVFKTPGDPTMRGVSVAVRNVVAPSGEAMALMNSLRRIGLPATWDHKPELPDDRTVELVVGRLR